MSIAISPKESVPVPLTFAFQGASKNNDHGLTLTAINLVFNDRTISVHIPANLFADHPCQLPFRISEIDQTTAFLTVKEINDLILKVGLLEKTGSSEREIKVKQPDSIDTDANYQLLFSNTGKDFDAKITKVWDETALSNGIESYIIKCDFNAILPGLMNVKILELSNAIKKQPTFAIPPQYVISNKVDAIDLKVRTLLASRLRKCMEPNARRSFFLEKLGPLWAEELMEAYITQCYKGLIPMKAYSQVAEVCSLFRELCEGKKG